MADTDKPADKPAADAPKQPTPASKQLTSASNLTYTTATATDEAQKAFGITKHDIRARPYKNLPVDTEASEAAECAENKGSKAEAEDENKDDPGHGPGPVPRPPPATGF